MEKYLTQLILTVVTLALTALLRVIMVKLIHRYARVSVHIQSRVNHIIKICVILLNISCLAVLITVWGVQPENIFLALSSIFAVIGVAFFAQWSILSNITAGLIVFFNSPFKQGDMIRIIDGDNSVEAKIVEIHTFYTHLKSAEDKLYVYPNSLLLQRGIVLLKEEKKE